MKHTPGPWKQEYQTYEDGPHTCVANQKGDWIADCGKEGNPESEANASLIAAAPELLKALKLIEGPQYAPEEDSDKEELRELLGQILQIARSAIAQAEK